MAKPVKKTKSKPRAGAKTASAKAKKAKQAAAAKQPKKRAAKRSRKRPIESYAIAALDALAKRDSERAALLLREAIGRADTPELRRELQGVWRGVGQRKMWSQEWPASIVFYEAALALGTGDSEVEAEIANDLGYVLQQVGRLDEAERHSRQALALHRAAERWDGVAGAYEHLSGIMFEGGRIQDAVELAREAVATSHQTGNTSDEVTHMYSLARALYEQGQTADADRVSREALPKVRQLGNTAIEGAFVNLIANVALDDNRAAEATERYDEARKLFRAVDLKNHEAITIANMGNVAWDCGRLDDALALYRKALRHHQRVRDERSAAIVMTDRAGVLVELGRFDEAHALLENALAIMVRLGHVRRVSFIRDAFAKLAETRGELELARAHYAEAEMSFDTIGDNIQIGRMLLAAAGLQAEIGDTGGAEILLARAAALDPAAGDTAATDRDPDDTVPLGTPIVPAGGAPRAGTAAVRALRELATGRIEVARARLAPPEEARALRASAGKRLAAIENAKDSLVGRSAEVRRVAARLRAALA